MHSSLPLELNSSCRMTFTLRSSATCAARRPPPPPPAGQRCPAPLCTALLWSMVGHSLAKQRTCQKRCRQVAAISDLASVRVRGRQGKAWLSGLPKPGTAYLSEGFGDELDAHYVLADASLCKWARHTGSRARAQRAVQAAPRSAELRRSRGSSCRSARMQSCCPTPPRIRTARRRKRNGLGRQRPQPAG